MGSSSAYSIKNHSFCSDFHPDVNFIILFVLYNGFGKRRIFYAQLFKVKSRFYNASSMMKSNVKFQFHLFRMPFDKKTPIGYGITLLIQILLFWLLLQTSISAMSFIMGYFKMMVSFGQDIQRKIWHLNANYEIEKRNKIKLNQLCDIIFLHSELKR